MPLRRHAQTILAAALTWCALLIGADAAPAASIWSQIASGTTAEITGIEYQSDLRFWFVTANGEIFTRQPGGAFTRTFGPSGVGLTDITFQRDGGLIGIAVGRNGQVLRSTNGGANWVDVNPGGTSIPVSKKSTTFPDCRASEPLGDVNSVRFAAAGRVWIMAEGAQLATSQPATAANVGAAATWVDANRDTHGTGSPDDDTCKLATGYAEGIDDAFFFPGNPDVAYFCTAYFGEIFFTSNNLATSGSKKPGSCGNGNTAERRMTGDPANPSRMWAAGPGGTGTSFLSRTIDGWGTSNPFTIVNPDAHDIGTPYDVASSGGIVVAVGDGGTIVNSVDGVNFFNNAGDGALLTAGWRAVSMASSSQAAIGGAGGALALTGQANSIPDIVAPTATIAGPTAVAAGQAATYTANAVDNAGGSGINPASFAWSAVGTAGATGNPAGIVFPAAGYYLLKVTFADNAGNPASATLGVTVTAGAPVIAPGTPNPQASKTVTVSGGKVTLAGPKTCVRVGKTFTATLSFKRAKRKGGNVIKVRRTDFFIDGKRVKIDRKAPFVQKLSVRSYQPNSRHKLKARAFLKVRRGKSPTKSISTAFQVCSS
jgi:hypothetical protein